MGLFKNLAGKLVQELAQGAVNDVTDAIPPERLPRDEYRPTPEAVAEMQALVPGWDYEDFRAFAAERWNDCYLWYLGRMKDGEFRSMVTPGFHREILQAQSWRQTDQHSQIPLMLKALEVGAQPHQASYWINAGRKDAHQVRGAAISVKAYGSVPLPMRIGNKERSGSEAVDTIEFVAGGDDPNPSRRFLVCGWGCVDQGGVVNTLSKLPIVGDLFDR